MWNIWSAILTLSAKTDRKLLELTNFMIFFFMSLCVCKSKKKIFFMKISYPKLCYSLHIVWTCDGCSECSLDRLGTQLWIHWSLMTCTLLQIRISLIFVHQPHVLQKVVYPVRDEVAMPIYVRQGFLQMWTKYVKWSNKTHERVYTHY